MKRKERRNEHLIGSSVNDVGWGELEDIAREGAHLGPVRDHDDGMLWFDGLEVIGVRVLVEERGRLGGVLGIARRTEEERVEEGLEVESSMGVRGPEEGRERGGTGRKGQARTDDGRISLGSLAHRRLEGEPSCVRACRLRTNTLSKVLQRHVDSAHLNRVLLLGEP
jgi:hypothetical protein